MKVMFLYFIAVVVAIISIVFEKVGYFFISISNKLADVANKIGLNILGYLNV